MRGAIGTASVVVALLAAGCSRSHYRKQADSETAAILHEKSCGTPWDVHGDYGPYPDPRSRLAHPDDPDCPALPPAAPRLNSYQLPATRSQRSTASPSTSVSQRRRTATVPLVLNPDSDQPDQFDDVILAAGADRSFDGDLQAPGSTAMQRGSRPVIPEGATSLPIMKIPDSAWAALPQSCQVRMLEFDSVRDEYRRTFESDVPDSLRSTARRLTLDDVIELSLMNNRSYQSEKERLYRAALALTLNRYDFDLNFTPTGNGTAVNYTHDRTGGETENTLGVTSGVGVQKILTTGGSLLARFANRVVLTFNGPQGFAADVNSELFAGLTQSLLQRDVRLEPLIQSERTVVYAARDFARFRKTFFFSHAQDYYTLLRQYRQIEIESLSYFSLVRALNQAEAEELAGLQTRVQVEQIEQSMLTGRQNLLTTCNGLETTFDRFKLTIGIPTETTVDLDLAELRELNLRDEVQVAADRTTRALRRLHTQRGKKQPDRGEILNSAIVLNDRLIDWLRLRESSGEVATGIRELVIVAALLRVDEGRLASDQAFDELQRIRKTDPRAPAILLFQRTADTADSLRRLSVLQLELADAIGGDMATIRSLRADVEKATVRGNELQDRLDAVLKESQVEQLDALVRDADALLIDIQNRVRAADQLIGAPEQRPTPERQLEQIQQQVRELTARAEQLLDETARGLVPVEIDPEEAMVSALLARLDLMNDRGRLADARREIKITADDLRSVLNLHAEETIRTHKNRPFDFTFDESQTQLGLTFDLPLNRQAQRNSYRRAIFDFEAASRTLIESEDNIKLAIRDELRNLTLARNQYEISVASAALAAERVQSTRIQLALGFPGIAARDFLEAQEAYRGSLSDVARDHIAYIIARAHFFLDAELMQLDEFGFWREIRQDHVQPVPIREFDPTAGPPYGDIPDLIGTSHEIRQIFNCQP